MVPYLIFNTKKLIKKVNTKNEYYEVKEDGNKLHILKKYRSALGRPLSVTLPEKIKISSEAVGLIVGEGFIGARNFVFANSNENAVVIVLDFLKQFNLPLHFYLEISAKGTTKHFTKKCNRFWKNRLKLKSLRTRLRKEFYNSTEFGTIHASVHNSLLVKLLYKIISLSKEKIEKSKKLSADYLKGVIAAEGNVNIKKRTNCVYMIRISASKPEERAHYKRCLERVGIRIFCEDMPTISPEEGIRRGWKTTKGRAGAVIISRWDNFVKVLELDLLELNEDKQSKFLRYFVNNKFTQQFLGFKEFIGKEFTIKEAQLCFGVKARPINRIMTLYKKEYASRRKIGKIRFVYKLTKKYLCLYTKLNSTLNSPICQ